MEVPNDCIRTDFRLEDDKLIVKRSQDALPTLKHVEWVRETGRKDHGDARWRYLGSLPMVIAEQWSRECGAAVGTAEFTTYARKKLMSGEFAKLQGFSW